MSSPRYCDICLGEIAEIAKGVLGYHECGLHLNRAPPEYTRCRYTGVVGTESLKNYRKKTTVRSAS